MLLSRRSKSRRLRQRLKDYLIFSLFSMCTALVAVLSENLSLDSPIIFAMDANILSDIIHKLTYIILNFDLILCSDRLSKCPTMTIVTTEYRLSGTHTSILNVSLSMVYSSLSSSRSLQSLSIV
jgi:hypothetical protein